VFHQSLVFGAQQLALGLELGHGRAQLLSTLRRRLSLSVLKLVRSALPVGALQSKLRRMIGRGFGERASRVVREKIDTSLVGLKTTEAE
jgi:hypothetical protein